MPQISPTPPAIKITPRIRWMIRADMREVLEIERASFEFCWSEDDFIRCLRQRNCIGMVAECTVGPGQAIGSKLGLTVDRIAGFMIYELHRSRLHVLNFAVHPDFRRRGVGAAMIDKLKGKLSPQRRSRIMLEVRETNLDAQLFFRNLRFRAVSLLRDFYEDTTEDAYLMQFRCEIGENLTAVG